jgi:hypothetical protein
VHHGQIKEGIPSGSGSCFESSWILKVCSSQTATCPSPGCHGPDLKGQACTRPGYAHVLEDVEWVKLVVTAALQTPSEQAQIARGATGEHRQAKVPITSRACICTDTGNVNVKSGT